MGLKASRPGVAGHDPAASALPARAAAGDQGAWDEIVERYAPMVWSICTRFRLSDRDLEDVAQNVWLLLVEHLGKLPEPVALAGWLAATTRRECLRVVTPAGAALADAALADAVLADAGPAADDTAIGEEIMMAERNAALRAALAELSPPCQRLLGMLVSDPPYSYAAISATLGIPVDGIGARRDRCLERIRESSALLGLAEVGGNRPGGDPGA
jgi:RNA polymerase sigma factor (sigma-70 family)